MVCSNRPTTENYYNNIYFITLQIYMLSEDRLLSQSIRSGRDVIQLCNIQYIYAIFNTYPITVAQLDL
ncbi:hypothetical protein GIB67_037192 [Kingdonia uniflora]|uniref:Uncharacterized protein n=1 Tax=Kingdonia uniflora TaxID=39325 RepID=A0A7J7MRQ0_9MAGN|nr:hypothetical protein GIB67_037192 [Kingdonia uniflora]